MYEASLGSWELIFTARRPKENEEIFSEWYRICTTKKEQTDMSKQQPEYKLEASSRLECTCKEEKELPKDS